MRSAARPDPSQTTTGTGGVSVTYSKTALIVFVPPSMTRHTTGVLECVTMMQIEIKQKKTEKREEMNESACIEQVHLCVCKIKIKQKLFDYSIKKYRNFGKFPTRALNN